MRKMRKIAICLSAWLLSQHAWAYPPCSFTSFEGVIGGVGVGGTKDYSMITLYNVGESKTETVSDSCSDGYSGITLGIGNLNNVLQKSMFDSCLQLANSAAADYRVSSQLGTPLKDMARFQMRVSADRIDCRIIYSGEAGSAYARSDWSSFTEKYFSK
jgi:hypothetical protein